MRHSLLSNFMKKVDMKIRGSIILTIVSYNVRISQYFSITFKDSILEKNREIFVKNKTKVIYFRLKSKNNILCSFIEINEFSEN